MRPILITHGPPSRPSIADNQISAHTHHHRSPTRRSARSAATWTTLQPDSITNTSTDHPGINSNRNVIPDTRVSEDGEPTQQSAAAPGDAVEDFQDGDSSPTVATVATVGEQNEENTSVSDESSPAPGAAVDGVQDDGQGVTISNLLIVTPEDTESTGVSNEQPFVKDEVCVQTDTDSRDVVKTKERRALIRKLRAENPDATDGEIADMDDVQADDQCGNFIHVNKNTR